jgi:acyl-CoA synthetase (AMP-forming)/AMP-acid ligase II
MVISDIVEWNARRYSNKAALIFGDTRISFAELDKHGNSLVNGLRHLGVKKGDRVAVLADTCYQYVEILLANPKGGIITVPINYRYVPQELAHVINNSEAQTVILGDGFRSSFDSVRPYLKQVNNVITMGESSPGMIGYDELISSYPSDKPKIECDEDDIVYLIYTSGTTSLPKGVMRSHKSILSGAIDLIIWQQLTSEEVCLLVLPPFHIAFIWPLIAYTYMGCTMLPLRWNAEGVLKLIEKERVTIINLVPTLVRDLLEFPRLSIYDFSSLRRIAYGASPMPEAILERVLNLFKCKIDHNYGMTEFCPIATLRAEERELEIAKGKKHILSSCGKELINVEVRVVDEAGEDVVPGQTGEIIVRGDGIMNGYWNLPEETATALKGGYLHTGDIGMTDEDGYLYIVDRAKDMIISGGENVYCPEVENVLCSHPSVLEAVVIGVPDERWVEVVKALVILRPGVKATEEEIIEFCRPRLAGYKRPKSVEFYKDFPRTAMGKISKKDLREKYRKPSPNA